MANLKNVIYLSNEDYETLVSTGTVTIDGDTLTYDENNVYVTPDKLASSTEDGLMSSTDKVKLDSLPTFGTAASKDFTTSVTSGSSGLVTSGAVYSAIDALPEPMIYKGTLGTGGTITDLPTASSTNEGFTYKVITDGTYASQAAKVGDLFISNGGVWTLVPSGDDAGEDTVRQINVNGTELLGTSITTGYVNFKNGSNVSISGSGHDITISATDTTYSDATTSASGLMSASDKTKLNGIASGAEVNVQADWNVTDSSSDAYIKNKPNLATVATSGSYNDLSDKPTIDNNNQKVKAGSVTFGDNATVDIVAGDNVTVTGLASGTGAPKITISATDTDTGATSVETTGSGNVVNSASYDASTRKLTLSKGVTALTSHQSIKTLKTDNTTAQSTSSSEAIAGSGTINLHKVAKTGTYSDLIGTPTIPDSDSDLTNDRYVRYDTASQGLTDTQKSNARTNIGAGTSSFSGNYNDLTNKPTIPTVNNGTLTIQSNGTSSGTFTANQSGNTTINLKTAEVIDVTDGVTADIKTKITNNPAIVLKYEDYYYMPQCGDGNEPPNWYNCFEGDSGSENFRWLEIDWDNLTVSDDSIEYATKNQIPTTIDELCTNSRTYTGLIGTSNEYRNASFFFLNVRPNDWNKEWSIKYRIEANLDDGLTPTNYEYMSSVHDCMIKGSRGYMNSYAFFNAINNTSYRVFYFNLLFETTKAGYDANQPHKIGVELTDAYARLDSNYKRTFKITIIEAIGCTYSFLDAPELPSNSTRTDYTKLNSTYYPYYADSNAPGYAWRGNCNSNGLQETGDNNTYNMTQLDYSYAINGTSNNGTELRILSYALLGYDSEGKVMGLSVYSLSQTSRTTDISTSRVYCDKGFDWHKPLVYQNSSAVVNPGANANYNYAVEYTAFDLRYSDNCVAGSSANNLGMVARKPVYLRGTIGSDGLFYLAPKTVTYNNTNYQRVWTQDLNETGYVYWFVGYPYYNSSYPDSLYQVDLFPTHELVYYDGTNVRPYNGLPMTSTAGKVLKSTSTAGTVEWGDSSGVTDVKIGTSSIVSSGVATIQTNSTYNASSNKIATMSDLPPTITISTGTTKSVSDGTNTLTFGSNAFNSTAIPTSYVASSSYNSSTKKLTITPNSGTATEVTFGSNAFNSTTIPTSYIASASASGNTLTITPNSGSAITYTPSFSESDTLATVTGRGATTSTAVTMSGGLDVTGNNLKLNKISAPTSSGGSTYGNGSSGQVLKSNGTTVYWASDSNADHYPTTFTWTNGTTSGPTGSLTGNSGFTAVSFGAIPSASDSQSGVITTGNQTFAGQKHFSHNDISFSGHITVYGDSDSSDTNKPSDETGFDDLDTYYYNTGITLVDGDVDEYQISFPGKSGIFALTDDLPDIIDLRG